MPLMLSESEPAIWLDEIYEKGYYSESTLERLKELYGDKIGTHRHKAGQRALTRCRVITFPRRPLHDLVESYPLMREAALTMQIKALWRSSRLHAASHIKVIAELGEAKARIKKLEDSSRRGAPVTPPVPA